MKRCIAVALLATLGCADVGEELHLQAKGLHTDPNPHILPEGALRTAKNVVIRSPGLVEPRPEFSGGSQEGLPNNAEIIGVFPFDGGRIYALAGSNAGLYNDDATEITDEDGTTIAFDSAEKATAVEAAGNLYITTSSGVRRVSSKTDTTAYRVGLPMALPGLVTAEDDGADNPWLASGDAVAYRCVYQRTVNGRDIRSSPSGRWTVERSTADPIAPEVTIPLHADVESGDRIEVYRSLAVTGEVGDTSDSLYLANTYHITSSDVSSGSITFTDELDESALGAALYTNPAQEGIAQSNFRPPKSDALALFNQMMFYGGSEGTHTKVLTLNARDSTYPSNGWVPRVYTGDVSTGSTTVSNLSSIKGLKVGQYVSTSGSSPFDPDTNFLAGTKIASIDGVDQITLDRDAQATNTTVDIFFHDWIDVDEPGGSSTQAFADQDDEEDFGVEAGLYSDDIGDFVEPPASVLERIAYEMNTDSSGSGGPVYAHVVRGIRSEATIVFVNRDPRGSAFEITGTYGNTIEVSGSVSRPPRGPWTPQLDDTTAVTSELEDRPGRVYVAKLQQPEHVPPENWFDVGNDKEPTLAIVPLRDSVLFFKTDGVYRVSGRTPQQLRVDPLDTALTLIHPKAVDVLDDRAIAWTDRGIVAVSDVGVTPISDPIKSALDPIQHAMLKATLDTSSESDVAGLFVQALDNRREVYVGVPASLSDDYTYTIYVFNARTGAWTTWDSEENLSAFAPFQIATAAVDPREDRLVFAGSFSGDPLVAHEKSPGSNPSASTAPPCTCEVEWVAKTGRAPATEKLWVDAVFILDSLPFDNFVFDDEIQAEFTSSVSSTADTIDMFPQGTNESGSKPWRFRVHVPTDHARSGILYPKFITRSVVDNYFQLAGLSLTYERVGRRVHR